MILGYRGNINIEIFLKELKRKRHASALPKETAGNMNPLESQRQLV